MDLEEELLRLWSLVGELSGTQLFLRILLPSSQRHRTTLQQQGISRPTQGESRECQRPGRSRRYRVSFTKVQSGYIKRCVALMSSIAGQMG